MSQVLNGTEKRAVQAQSSLSKFLELPGYIGAVDGHQTKLISIRTQSDRQVITVEDIIDSYRGWCDYVEYTLSLCLEKEVGISLIKDVFPNIIAIILSLLLLSHQLSILS